MLQQQQLNPGAGGQNISQAQQLLAQQQFNLIQQQRQLQTQTQQRQMQQDMINKINMSGLSAAQQAQLIQQTMRVGGNQVEVSSGAQMNGEMPLPKTDPLESNPELGVYFMQEN